MHTTRTSTIITTIACNSSWRVCVNCVRYHRARRRNDSPSLMRKSQPQLPAPRTRVCHINPDNRGGYVQEETKHLAKFSIPVDRMRWHFQLSEHVARSQRSIRNVRHAEPHGASLEYWDRQEVAGLSVRRDVDFSHSFSNDAPHGIPPETQTTVSEHARNEEIRLGELTVMEQANLRS